MTKLERRTKKMAEKMIGHWVTLNYGYNTEILKVTGYDRNGMRIRATKFGEEGSHMLRTRKYRLATEHEVAEVVANRIQPSSDIYEYKVEYDFGPRRPGPRSVTVQVKGHHGP